MARGHEEVELEEVQEGTQNDNVPAGDIDAEMRAAGAPDSFFCSMSMTLMRDPVMIETGHTCDIRPSIVFCIAFE